METQRGERLHFPLRVNRAHVWDTVPITVVGDNVVQQRDEQILDVLTPAGSQVGRERIQNNQVFVCRVEQRL